ncbi:MAG: hypothetical protein EHM23_36630, partial [Acidobacteria bacterium]
MKLHRVRLISTTLLLVSGLVGRTPDSYAQVTKLPDPSSFSAQSVTLLDEFFLSGTLQVGEVHLTEVDASRVDSVYGVTFFAAEGGSPRLGSVRLFQGDFAFDDVLVNFPVTGSSANRSLIFQFRLPLRRLGLYLGGPPRPS